MKLIGRSFSSIILNISELPSFLYETEIKPRSLLSENALLQYIKPVPNFTIRVSGCAQARGIRQAMPKTL